VVLLLVSLTICLECQFKEFIAIFCHEARRESKKSIQKLMQQSSQESGAQMASKMGVWLLMISIAIVFGALSLAYMVTGERPVDFSVPWGFYANTLILIASSVLLHIGWLRRGQQGRGMILRPAMWLGLAFLISQVFAWYQLYSHGMDLTSAGQKVSYLYLLTGLHAAHLIGGILFLGWVWARYQSIGRKYLETAVYFWHFLGVLWVYLLCVLITNA